MGWGIRKVGHHLYPYLNSNDVIFPRYYYQYWEDWLSACPTVLHGLLHMPQNICECGPSWTTWTFFIEHCCGLLKATLHSKSQPWGNLNNWRTQLACLNQLAACYDLAKELNIVDLYRVTNNPTWFEQVFEDCKHHLLQFSYTDLFLAADEDFILWPPLRKIFNPDQALRLKISTYIKSVIGHQTSRITSRLPQSMPWWGKMRLINGGDKVRSVMATPKQGNPREMCYVWVILWFCYYY